MEDDWSHNLLPKHVEHDSTINLCLVHIGVATVHNEIIITVAEGLRDQLRKWPTFTCDLPLQYIVVIAD